MRYPVGRNLRIEVQKTTGAAITVTAVTVASPGVATAAAHGLANGAVGYFEDVTGMLQLDGQAIRVSAAATDNFTLQRFDTSRFGAFTAGKFVPVTAWSTLGHATRYAIAGGEATDEDQTTLIDMIDQTYPGRLPAQTVQIEGFSAMNSEAMELIEAAALGQEALAFRITLNEGAQRVFCGIPSLPGEEGDVGTSLRGSFGINTRGRVLYLPEVAA